MNVAKNALKVDTMVHCISTQWASLWSDLRHASHILRGDFFASQDPKKLMRYFTKKNCISEAGIFVKRFI